MIARDLKKQSHIICKCPLIVAKVEGFFSNEGIVFSVSFLILPILWAFHFSLKKDNMKVLQKLEQNGYYFENSLMDFKIFIKISLSFTSILYELKKWFN